MSFGEWFGLLMAVDGEMGKVECRLGKVEWRLGQVQVKVNRKFAQIFPR